MKTILKLKTKRDHFLRSILRSGIILQNNPFLGTVSTHENLIFE